MKKIDSSALTPLSREQRQEADRQRLARLDADTSAHENSIRERELSEMRRLKSQNNLGFLEGARLDRLTAKYGRSAT